MSLTVVHSLIDKYNISYNDIGRIEVGTAAMTNGIESVSTVLMSLFHDLHEVMAPATGGAHGTEMSIDEAINAERRRVRNDSVPSAGVVFLLPPVGWQHVNMGRALFDKNAEFERALRECELICEREGLLPRPLLEV